MSRRGKQRVLVLVPDGVGVRNFVLGSFLRDLSDRHEVVAMHVVPDDMLSEYTTRVGSAVDWRPFPRLRDSVWSYTLRYALAYAQMFWVATQSMKFNMSRPRRLSLKAGLADRVARIMGRLSAGPTGIARLVRWHTRAVSRLSAYRESQRLLRELRPDVVFSTHQRPPLIIPVVEAARSLGIPTATFIFSWDNLTSKGRIAAPFDHYLVWSELMATELCTHYPDVTRNRVHIVGTPQFDPYADQDLVWTREEFFSQIGADPDRPLVCYSGGDTGGCPEDHEHLRTLLHLVRSGRILPRPQVVLRPAPVDDGARYEPVRRDYPELIIARPKWRQAVPGKWRLALPSAEDVQLLANLTRYADVNVNFGSTMTLDFSVRDRPVVNIAFDVADPPPFGVPLYEHQCKFEHYRPVIEFGAARFAKSPDELARHVQAYLEDPALDREGRARLVALEVGQPVGRSTGLVVEALEQIVSNGEGGVASRRPTEAPEVGEAATQAV